MSLPVSNYPIVSLPETYRTMLEEQSRRANEQYQRTIDSLNRSWESDREALRRERETSTRWRQTCNNGTHVILELRREKTELEARLDQSDRDNGNLRDSLQRIELLIGDRIPTQEIAFRSSCIKYTSPAYWVFSIYDMVYGFCSALKTHLCGIKSILLG